jgi:23S rRNA U2552 (ribose-2'-O)-methylase RlmE/FtsJ
MSKIEKNKKSNIKKNNKDIKDDKPLKEKKNKKIIDETLSTSTDSDVTDDKTVKSDTVIDYDSLKHKIILPSIELNNSTNIFDFESNMKFSYNIDYCNFDLGFNAYLHENKKKMEILNSYKEKKNKAFRVLNKFERYIDKYDESIGLYSKKYFELTKEKIPDILSRGFYKLWEIYFMFDLIDVDNDDFISAHLAEGPGSFIQATMFFRDMFSNKGLSKNDKYYAVTLHSEDSNKHVPELEEEFVSYYSKEKPQRFLLHKTYTKEMSGGSKNMDNGDLTNPKTIKLFGGSMVNKANIVTADGGFDWANENVQEQEAYQLLLAQIITASKIQKIKGHFICKFFETFTYTSCKIISILTELYENVYFVKPLTSRPSNSEKYAVCMNFKYSEKDKKFKEISKKLDDLIEVAHKNKYKDKIIDIFSEYKITQEFKASMIEINTHVANEQYKSINDINRFISAQNFYGDVYQEKREEQIFWSKYWINLFFPDQKDFIKSKKMAKELLTNSLNFNKKNMEKINNTLTY